MANPSAFAGVPTPGFWGSYFSWADNALEKFSTGGVDTIAKWLAHPISSFNEWYVDGTLFFNANDPHIAQLEASGALRQAVDNKGNAMSGYYLLFVEDQVMVLTVAGGDYFLIGTQKYLPNYSDQAIVGGYQINQSQRWLAWADAGLTVALHLVPLLLRGECQPALVERSREPRRADTRPAMGPLAKHECVPLKSPRGATQFPGGAWGSWPGSVLRPRNSRACVWRSGV